MLEIFSEGMMYVFVDSISSPNILDYPKLICHHWTFAESSWESKTIRIKCARICKMTKLKQPNNTHLTISLFTTTQLTDINRTTHTAYFKMCHNPNITISPLRSSFLFVGHYAHTQPISGALVSIYLWLCGIICVSSSMPFHYSGAIIRRRPRRNQIIIIVIRAHILRSFFNTSYYWHHACNTFILLFAG